MFDPNRFVSLARGALLETEQTWTSYHAENRPWQYTAANLTAPLIVLSMLAAGLVAWLLNSGPQFGGFGLWLLAAIMGVVQFALAVLIFTVLAGAMGGKQDFNRGTAALSLAAVPAYLGNALGTFPWIGWLIAIGLGILGLVHLYRILPSYLEVPESKRVLHFVVSLLATAITAVVLGSILGIGAGVDAIGDRASVRVFESGDDDDDAAGRAGGYLGEIQRNAEIYDAAMADTYEPPGNGRLKQAQVEEYVRVMTRAKAMQDEYAARMERLSEEMKDKEDANISDLVNVFRGMGGAVTASNATMDIVKTSGGNWAEHVWVEEQLRVAKFQPDASDAATKNRKLYDEFKTALDDVAPF